MVNYLKCMAHTGLCLQQVRKAASNNTMLIKYGNAFRHWFVFFCVLLQVTPNYSQKDTTDEPFQAIQSRVNWYEALINCRNLGMDLVSIHSKKEQMALEEFLIQHPTQPYEKDASRYWLGATKEGNGQFYWVTTGAKMVFTKWLIDQPDNYNGDQHCLAQATRSFNSDYVDGGWDDLSCLRQLPYICQRVQYCFQSDENFNKL